MLPVSNALRPGIVFASLAVALVLLSGSSVARASIVTIDIGGVLVVFDNGQRFGFGAVSGPGPAPLFLGAVSDLALAGNGSCCPTLEDTWTGVLVGAVDPVNNVRYALSSATVTNDVGFSSVFSFVELESHTTFNGIAVDRDFLFGPGVDSGGGGTFLGGGTAVPLSYAVGVTHDQRWRVGAGGSAGSGALRIIAGTVPVYQPTAPGGSVQTFVVPGVGALANYVDPKTAPGFDFVIGPGDPLFASVVLPHVGDGVYTIVAGGLQHTVLAGETFTFGGGVAGFRVLGIETGGGPEPFMTGLGFSGPGNFTGSVTVIPLPAAWLMFGTSAGLLLLHRGLDRFRSRRC